MISGAKTEYFPSPTNGTETTGKIADDVLPTTTLTCILPDVQVLRVSVQEVQRLMRTIG